MRSEWRRTTACAAVQIAALAGLVAWTGWADPVPYREILVWSSPLFGIWAGRAAAALGACVAERRRLEREVRLAVRWRDVRP